MHLMLLHAFVSDWSNFTTEERLFSVNLDRHLTMGDKTLFPKSLRKTVITVTLCPYCWTFGY